MQATPRSIRVRAAGAAAAMLLLLAGCSSGGSGSEGSAGDGGAPTGEAAPAESTTTTEAPAVDLPDSAPAGEVVLEDPFDDDANGWIGDGGAASSAVTADIDGGFLTVSGPDREEGLDLWPDEIAPDAEDFTDQRVTASFALTEMSAGNVLCRVEPEGEYARQYMFTINPKRGLFHIRKADGTEAGPSGLEIVPHEVLTQLQEGETLDDIEYEPAFEFDEDHVYVVTGQCTDVEDGVELTMFVDGEQVAQVVDTDDPITSGVGGVGLEGTSDDDAWGISVDDFVFEALDEGGAGSAGSDDEEDADGSDDDDDASSSDGGEASADEERDWSDGDVVETEQISFPIPEGFGGSDSATLPFDVENDDDASFWVYTPEEGESAEAVGAEAIENRILKEGMVITSDPEPVTVGDLDAVMYRLEFQDGYESVSVFAQDPDSGLVFTFEVEGPDLEDAWPAVEEALEDVEVSR